jgi:hypothetical protein
MAVAKAGNVEHAEYAAWKETQVLGDLASYVRTLTHALIIAQTYFGNGPYSMLLAPAAAGDAIDAHFYSRYAPSDTNGLLSGQSATDKRSRFAAVLAGCNVLGPGGQARPQFVTEWGPVCQYKPFAQDAVTERSQVLSAVVAAAIAQDVDLIALYSWAHSPVFCEGSPYWRPDVYDFRVDPVLTNGLPAQVAAFHDLSLRPKTSVNVTPTNGVYGEMITNAAGQTVYEQFGPYTDPALYAVPAGTKVVMSAATPATGGTEATQVAA